MYTTGGGGWGLGDMAAGLGELLPVIATPGFQQVQVDQYDALASGRASGGNFERYQDGAELGYFSRDKAGYANYLAYNSLGLSDPRFKGLPTYVGWTIAGNMAYAVVNRMHVGNNLSPLYDVDAAKKNGIAGVLAAAQNLQWNDADRQAALNSFADNLTRLLGKWHYSGGTVTVATPVMVRNPYFDAIGRGPVWVDKATITYDGPDPDPNVIGGRMFSAGGATWRWGGTPRPVSSSPAPTPAPMPPTPAPTPNLAPVPQLTPTPGGVTSQVPWVDIAVPAPPMAPAAGGPPSFEVDPGAVPPEVPAVVPTAPSSSSSGLLWLAGGGLALVLIARRKRRRGGR